LYFGYFGVFAAENTTLEEVPSDETTFMGKKLPSCP
jgi:hypothetical protein